LRTGMAGGFRRQILASPCGSGKTEIGMEIVRGALAKGKRVAFLCNRINLITQTSERFYKSDILHGIIQGQNTARTYSNVMIISIQTAAKRGMPETDLLIIDEAHGVAGSKAYRELIEKFKGPVIGLSATPFSKGLGKHYASLGGTLFENIVVATTIGKLIDQGHLVDVEVFAPSEPDLARVKITAGDYNEKELGVAVDKIALIGDIVANWKKLADGTATVCFATNIAHSKHIVEQFIAAGVSAEHMDCYTTDDDRKSILRRVADGETTIISNVGILCEGWDFPACKTLILARPTRSLVRFMQMAGRVLRPFPGKTVARILDHSGTVQRLGFPTDDLPMVLDDGKAREAADQKPEEKLPKPCPACKFVKPVGVHTCPKCGFAPEKRDAVAVAEGVLVKLIRGGKKELTALEKGRLFGELKSIAADRNWSKGRLAHVFRDIVGTWPNAYGAVPAVPPSQDTLKKVQYLHIRFAKRMKKEASHEG